MSLALTAERGHSISHTHTLIVVPFSKLQRHLGLWFIEGGRRTADDKSGTSVATQALLQHSSELAVTIRNMRALEKREKVREMTKYD